MLASSLASSMAYDKYTTNFYTGNHDNVALKSDPFININNRYYYFGTDPQNWYVAYEKCRALSSELVTFDSLEEFEAIAKYLKARGDRNEYWTSGNDLGREGTYNWFSTGKQLSISKWAPNQPDNSAGRENCIHMGYIYTYSKDFELNDRPCESLFRYICEAPEPETISIVVWK
ncbi:uncharacterized protein Dwil_GK23836 [Drosophila willistoni]|uniref:C-type lectin domain-containing protein n=2 Tax=Drosophila willistoni TaxID=7260 RepID=B4MTG6_DROWI|nr:uncharacterized protein Dwil_GK23836 [Drosophila willistoni]